MKKYLFIAAAALTMMAGCNKYKVEVGNPTDQIVDNDTAPVAVMLSAATNTVDVKTKAAMESWSDTPIFVYAFERDLESLEAQSLFINNKQATVADGGNVALWAEDPVSGTEETEGTDGVPYYYLEGDVYDFYGYYLGTELGENNQETPIQPAPGEINISGKTISFPVTITGAEDIMIAKADPKADVVKSTKPDLNITNYDKYVYGSFAARRGVQPNLKFEHVLTRFTFLVKDGLAEASGLKVFDIKSPATENSTATLTVVGDDRGIGNVDTPAILEVAIADEGVEVAGYSEVDTESKPLWADAGDLMLFEGGNSKVFEFSIGEDADNAQKVNVTVECPGDENATFEAGKKYVVSVRVYGPEAVTATAEIAEWDEVKVPEIDSNTLPVQEFDLIDGKKLLVDANGIMVKEGDANPTAPTDDANYYTIDGYKISYDHDATGNKVSFAKAQELEVTLEGADTPVKAYHYVNVTPPALPAPPAAGDVVYVTEGETKTGVFTLVWTDGKTYQFTIVNGYTVEANAAVVKTVSSIAVKEGSTHKTSFTTNEEFSSEGLIIVVTYDDATTAEISEGFIVTGPQEMTAGPHEVTVTYESKTTTYEITVTQA